MFKLQDLRNHRHLKWPVRIFFAIVIISFIFFYGWNQNQSNKQTNANRFAKLLKPYPLPFIHHHLPFDRWEYIDGGLLAEVQDQAVNEKIALLPQGWAQMVYRQANVDRLVTNDDIAMTAVNRLLGERAARKLQIHVPLQKIIDLLNDEPNVNDESLQRMADHLKMSKVQYLDFLRENADVLRVKQVQELLAHASLFELWQEYRLANEKMTMQMAAYPIADYEKKVVVTDRDLAKYLADHKEKFHVPPQRRYAYLKLAKEDLRAPIKPTDKQLQAYYEQNQSQYLEKKATQTEELFAPLTESQSASDTLSIISAMKAAKPEAAKEHDWNTLAQRLNQKNPGKQFLRTETWIEEDSQTRSPSYIHAMKTLAKDQVSSPILESQHGVYLIRVVGQRAGGVPALSAIRPRVENDYVSKKLDDQFKEKAEEWNQAVKEIKDSGAANPPLRLLAQKLKIKDELTTRVNASDATLPGVGTFTQDKDYIAGLGLNEISDVLQTADQLTVLQVFWGGGDYDPKLSEVRTDVDAAVRKERAVDLARQDAEQSLNLLKNGAEFSQALAKAPKAPFTTEAFTRQSPVESLGAPMIDFPKQTLKVNTGSIGLTPYGNDSKEPLGFAVWQVKKLEPPSQDQFAKERQKFEQDYLQLQRDTIVREWLADLRQKAQYQLVEEKAKE